MLPIKPWFHVQLLREIILAFIDCWRFEIIACNYFSTWFHVHYYCMQLFWNLGGASCQSVCRLPMYLYTYLCNYVLTYLMYLCMYLCTSVHTYVYIHDYHFCPLCCSTVILTIWYDVFTLYAEGSAVKGLQSAQSGTRSTQSQSRRRGRKTADNRIVSSTTTTSAEIK